jgi:HK97 family phage portal protein
MRVRSERLDVARPANLATSGRSFSNLFRGKTISTTGIERYGTDPTLFPIVSGLAQDTAAVKLHLYAPGPTQQDEDRVEILAGEHPAVDLLAKPNPFHSRSNLIESSQQHVDLVGETTILVEYIGSMPVRLWTIPPWKMQPVKADIVRTPSAQQFLRGWIYTSDSGEEIPLALKEVIQIKLPNPADPWRGIGPVQAALTFLDSSRFSAEWNRNFFVNGAEPGGLIQIEESMQDDEWNEFQDRWRESHQGLNNAHRVAMLENGAVWVPNQVTQRDMQFQELQMLSSDFIRKAFRFPKTMLGDTDNANRAVAEAGEYTYGKWMIEPRASRWVAALNDLLMPLFGKDSRGLVWDFDPVVERDDKTEADTVAVRATAAQTLISTGVDAEDAFAVSGLPPMKWTKPEPVLPPGGFGGSKDNPSQPPGKDGGTGKDGPKPGDPEAGEN